MPTAASLLGCPTNLLRPADIHTTHTRIRTAYSFFKELFTALTENAKVRRRQPPCSAVTDPCPGRYVQTPPFTPNNHTTRHASVKYTAEKSSFIPMLQADDSLRSEKLQVKSGGDMEK